MPRHQRRYRKRDVYGPPVESPEQLLAILERHGFMEVPVGQDQEVTDPRQDHRNEGGASQGRVAAHA